MVRSSAHVDFLFGNYNMQIYVLWPLALPSCAPVLVFSLEFPFIASQKPHAGADAELTLALVLRQKVLAENSAAQSERK